MWGSNAANPLVKGIGRSFGNLMENFEKRIEPTEPPPPKGWARESEEESAVPLWGISV